MLQDGPIHGQIAATAVRDDASGVLLPLIDLVAISTSRREAAILARRSASALDMYVARQQTANNVPTSDRVVVRTIDEPRVPQVYQPRSKTMAIVVFLAVMLATVGLAFLLENLRPRVRVVADAPEQDFERGARRRTA
jgi:capsular polysaccharide biosynthesis protein